MGGCLALGGFQSEERKDIFNKHMLIQRTESINVIIVEKVSLIGKSSMITSILILGPNPIYANIVLWVLLVEVLISCMKKII